MTQAELPVELAHVVESILIELKERVDCCVELARKLDLRGVSLVIGPVTCRQDFDRHFHRLNSLVDIAILEVL